MEFSRCGGAYAHNADNDDDVSFKRALSQNSSSSIKDEWTVRNYYFAAVTFEGNSSHVRFTAKAKNFLGSGTSEVSNIASSVRDFLLLKLRRDSPLGVAYWRLATDTTRGDFYWYNPPLREKEFERIENWPQKVDLNRMRAWFSGVRQCANEYEGLFDWSKHDNAHDLGTYYKEIEND